MKVRLELTMKSAQTGARSAPVQPKAAARQGRPQAAARQGFFWSSAEPTVAKDQYYP